MNLSRESSDLAAVCALTLFLGAIMIWLAVLA